MLTGVEGASPVLASRAGVGVQQRLPRFEEALDELVRHVERRGHAVS